MFSFRSLRTRLTVLYTGLFALVMLLVLGGVYSAISTNVVGVVRNELAASGTVFDRIWALRADQVENGAELLSRDFGFRSAIASKDDATIASALDNLGMRLGVNLAFLIGTDGRIISGHGYVKLDGATLAALRQEESTSGVMVIDHAPYEVISTPVLAPLPMGWVVFASRMDSAQMRLLERLSAIPLDASILIHDPAKGWRAPGRSTDTSPGLDRFVDKQLLSGGAPGVLRAVGQPSIVMAKRLQPISGGPPAVLLLRYPLSRALAPYQTLLLALVAVGVVGAVLVAFGSWVLARSVTRPIFLLEDAAVRLSQGEDATVPVHGDDEIAHLAEGFNAMAAKIRERERRINHLALHDTESGLPNRYALERDIETLDAGSEQGPTVVTAMEINRFAQVRAAIGHELSGVLVGEIGRRITTTTGLRVSRLSTSVLGVAFRRPDSAAAFDLVDRLHKVAEEPVVLGGTAIDVSLTSGLASPMRSGEPTETVIARANIALDQALRTSRRIAVFDAVAYGDPATNLSLMGDMRRSIAEGDLALYYQPKLDLRLQRTTGVEALARWRHPLRGMISPAVFVPMAEETGHIRALTDWVLNVAIADQRRMITAGHHLAVSVNISGRLVGDPEFTEHALTMIEGAMGKICFEITETAVIDNPEKALAAIERFVAAGVKVSIDDYGVGLSSLTYLKQIRADELKVDMSFISGVADNERDALLVKSTIDLAHALKLEVTGEGVENALVCETLRAMGCDHAQGFFVAQPLALSDLLAFLEREQRLATESR